jgi:hypothetical protein
MQAREWAEYWRLRVALERDAVAAIDTDHQVAGGLLDFLSGHCFGCSIEVMESEEELCEECRRRRHWVLN